MLQSNIASTSLIAFVLAAVGPACASQTEAADDGSDEANFTVAAPLSFDFQASVERESPEASNLSLNNAFWMGQLSKLAYEDQAVLASKLTALKIPQTKLVTFGSKVTGAQGFYLNTGKAGFLIFRGTEIKPVDLLTDADGVRKLPLGPGGAFAHSGFTRSVRSLWGAERIAIDANTIDIRKLIVDHKGPLYFGGHSLGGALAVVAAHMATFDGCRINAAGAVTDWDTSAAALDASKVAGTSRYTTECLNRGIPMAGIYTFGQPAVGEENLVKILELRLKSEQIAYFRFVNRNDPVPSLSPKLFKYAHVGDNGDVAGRAEFLAPTGQLVHKSLVGRKGPDCVNLAHDHDMLRYLKKIRNFATGGKFNVSSCRDEANEEKLLK
jgi:Lipase (class 3)